MKNLKIFTILLLLPFVLTAQQKTKKTLKKDKPQRDAFENTWLIDNPTNVIHKKGTLQFDIQHRFGTLNGKNDMLGFWAPANIRLSLNYAFTNSIAIGLGTTKNNRLVDVNARVAVLRQMRSDKIPISITFYGNIAADTRLKENFNKNRERYSFYSQFIITRRFSRNFSMQIAPSLSHYNIVEQGNNNDQFSVSLGASARISPQTAIIAEYSQPITQQKINKPYAGFGLGLEFSTGSHVFQVIATNYKGILPQKNYMFNQNKISNGDILIGFNITRLWNF